MNELAHQRSNGKGLRELALFAGAGGGILGAHLLGWRPVCAVEYNAYARSVLLARQNDGTLPPFPIWDDVRTFDGHPWRGAVDVVSGGFPCQDISVAGSGKGLEGERSGLWSEMARIIREVRPRSVVVENSPMLAGRGLGRVLGDLAEMGFDARWGVISAASTGAPHLRERMWIVAHANGELRNGSWSLGEAWGIQSPDSGGILADAASKRQPGPWESIYTSYSAEDREGQAGNALNVRIGSEWPAEPKVGRVVDGMAHRMDQLKALGNGQVPRVVAAAWRLLA